jgi:signal transduction histidine kinase
VNSLWLSEVQVALGIENDRAVWITAKRLYPLSTGFLAFLTAVVSYLGARLGDTLVLPPHGSVFWPGSAFLLAVLLLTPRKTWPVVIPAGLAGLVLHDLQFGFSHRTVALFFLGCTIETLIPAVGLRYSFVGTPRLNSLKALAKYSLFAVLGPFVANFVGAFAVPGRYWTDFRLFVFSDAIAFLIFTPALLSWAGPRSERNKHSTESKLEGAALVSALVLLASAIFFFNWRTPRVPLIYSFVPILVWAALRFGSKGVNTSVIVITFASIWGSMHGHGPFIGSDPLHSVLSLQVFLVFAATPFMALAAVVEERESARLVEKELSRRLISAQEQERIRIARELHDDVCQRLAMLSHRIEKAANYDGNGKVPVAEQLEQIWQQCSSLAGDVQAMSHELHPSILENLGLSTAVKSYCREVAQQNGVVVEVSDGTLPGSLPQDVSLSVFRVVQEALRNAVKYSGQKHIKVCLQEKSGQLELEVSDQGVGFNVRDKRNSGGLGLVSMAERISQVNGTFSIDSQLNVGTLIRARVPLAAKANAMPNAAI